MSSFPSHIAERIDDLLIELATTGLSATDQSELNRLLATAPGTYPQEMELVVAAADLAMMASTAIAPMPVSLRSKVIAQSAEWTGARAVRAAASAPATQRDVVAKIEPMRDPAFMSKVGWWVAAAALVIAAIGWVSQPGAQPGRPGGATATLTARESMLKLLGDADDVVRVAWTPTEDPAAKTPAGGKAAGEVVWSNERQEGYMVFKGLAVNDPRAEQYQLWIFDVNQDEKYPMHGGVFDIPPGQTEVVVPIKAMLPVTKPTLFAVTREKPGGVWVSDRQRLPVLAKLN